MDDMDPSEYYVVRRGEYDDMKAEIEQLRAELNSMASAQAGWGQVERLRAENERLRAAGDALAATWPDSERCNCNGSDCRAVVEALSAWEADRG